MGELIKINNLGPEPIVEDARDPKGNEYTRLTYSNGLEVLVKEVNGENEIYSNYQLDKQPDGTYSPNFNVKQPLI